MGITKIDWDYLSSNYFFVKLLLSLAAAFLLFVGYSYLVPSPGPRDIVDQQFQVMDSLVAVYKNDAELTVEQKEKIREETNRIFQNYAQEDRGYVSNDSTEQLVPIFEERLILLEKFEQLFPTSYQTYLPNREYVEQELVVLRFLTEHHQDYVTYKIHAPLFEKILLFLGYGGILAIFALLTGSYFQRKQSHGTLMEILPVAMTKQILAEFRYSLTLFYFFPTVVILFLAGLYSGFLAGDNLFAYPVYQSTEQGNILISMDKLFLIILLYSILSCLFLYILQDYLVTFIRDSTISTVLFYLVISITIWNKLAWLPFFHVFPGPILQNGGHIGVSACILFLSTTCLMSLKFIKERLAVIRRWK